MTTGKREDGADRKGVAGARRDAVLVVGAIIVDLLCPVPRVPRSGEGVVADGVRASVGGCAFNTANVLRQLGVPYCLFAPVGQGMFSEVARRQLAARGLKAPLEPVSFASDGTPRDNGACACFVEPDGQRTMLTMPGIDRHFERAWFDELDADAFCCGVISGYEVEGEGGDAIVSFFEEHPNLQLYYAPGPRILGVGAWKTARINALRPVWHLNDQEALAYTGRDALEDAGADLVAACRNVVVITAGSEGSHLFAPASLLEADEHPVSPCASGILHGGDEVWRASANEERHVLANEVRHVLMPAEAVPSDRVADTVGAGDSHLGALMAARAAGRSWEESLLLANRVAAAVCTVSGSTLPDDAFAALDVSL